MGIDPRSVNVRDLELSRPTRTGGYGDQVGAPSVLGTGLAALVTELPKSRLFRRTDGRDSVVIAEVFLSPVKTAAGALVEIRDGDFAAWTNKQGGAVEAQEIVNVSTTSDCDGELDVLVLGVGRTSAVGV